MPNWSRWLFAPFHVLALATGAKSFRDNPVLGSAALNRRGLHLRRKRLAARLAERRRRRLAAGLSAEERRDFERDGYLAIPDFLPPAQFERMRAELLDRAAPAREFVDGYSLTRLLPLDALTLRQLPETARALASPRYRALHHYVGSFRMAPHLFLQTVFSGVRAAPPDVQSHFHSDTFHPTVKSWLTLTDVPGDAAAFTYVPGSHRPTRRHLAWERRVSIAAAGHADRLTGEGSLRIEEAMLPRLGYSPPRKLAVRANTLVIADTSGFHRRGISQGAACRISIWAYARGTPFQPWAGLGLGRGPRIAVRIFWAVQDALGLAGGWRWVGARRPDAPPAPLQ
ncbi:phytanoyl-CoA dioxygenase family protein [Belnapia sp. T6]|uniref:Phytanoyl-CoA dioxygenase family protein n=1 Tax=Belnapia mucosa TaxID=2804532 RepID=A0ABS1V2C0_9PROT|nr:phytanoyl-CoA dioxygenase family protein [Belnapia mucosa]MBL6454448.1 phytanoyl-CoA dioxygenase family protein [Belnapia mucosa]